MDRETFSNDSVVAEMKDVLCYAIDGESGTGKPIARKYSVQSYPTLIFLDPDGQRRDQMKGFMSARSFIKEVQRIKRNERTLSGPRKRIEKNPNDLEARYELALKLRSIGDKEGYKREIELIKKLDPLGKSPTVRKIRLAEITSKLNRDLDLEPLRAFLDGETDPELLFSGWYMVWKFEKELIKKARGDAQRKERVTRWAATSRIFWQYVPKERIATYGNNIAWGFYELRNDLTDADLAFALEVATKTAAAAPDDVSVIDTLACCQYAAGKHDEARRSIRRCIELEPKNPKWKKRLESFGG